MRRFLPVLCACLMLAAPARAQLSPLLDGLRRPPPRTQTPRLGTAILARTPSGQAGLAALTAPASRAHKTRRLPPEIGDRQTFNTARFLNLGWEPLEFTLVAKGDGFHLWVSTRELESGQVLDDDIDTLVDALAAHTPPASVDPNAGILANNHALFGTEPDMDGDGIVDVLWFDIFDDYPSGPPLVGYVAPQDYDPNAAPGIGNQADVLYVDVDPLLVGDGFGPDAVAETVASLHQQLIQFHEDPDEGPFTAQGLAGWAAVANGYDGPGQAYLTDVAEHAIALFSWENVLEDVERATLFVGYLTEQLGVEAAGALTREPADEADGVAAVLAAFDPTRTLPAFVLDFHTANYVNDPLVDARWGYTAPANQGAAAVPSRQVDASLAPMPETPQEAIALLPGAVQYLAWDFVDGFSLTLDTVLPAQRSGLLVRVVGVRADGTTTVTDLAPGPAPQAIAGPYDRVTAVVVNTEMDPAATPLSFTYSAAWTRSSLAVENVAYDDGQWSGDVVGLDNTWQQATRFDVPPGARPGIVSVAPYFLNRFFDAAGNPLADPEAPRDFVLNVWDAGADGLPGTLLFSREVVDPRPYSFAFANGFDLEFLQEDLSTEPALDALPPTIYVGLSNRGVDANPLTAVFVDYAPENVSYLFGDVGGISAWRAVWDLTAGSSPPVPLSGKAIPVRVQFLLNAGPTPVEAAPDLPHGLMLHPHYPNPVRGRATLRYELPHTTPVRITVYDVLGREVARPVDAVQPAGSHTLPLDARGWAPGLYVYVVETAAGRQARTMPVIR